MKKFIVSFAVVISCFTLNAQESEISTYYLIRHAEKERAVTSNKNPSLNENGIIRAEKWNEIFKNVQFDAIYATNFNRTIQTATPTAISKNLEIQFYNPSKLFDEEFALKTKGKTVLVVGHSNTTPLFVNAILGKEKYEEINDLVNSHLYIVTVTSNSKTAILLVIE